MSNLIEIRDEAFGASAPSHDRIKFELAIFKNEGYSVHENENVGTLRAQVNESLVPEIVTGCMRLIPAFREQQSEIKIESDKNAPEEYDQILIENLSNWKKMYEEVYDEGMAMRAAIYRNLTVGNAIDKIKYDPDRRLVCAEGINPTNFAPDPKGCQSNFADSDYVCQKGFHNRRYIKRHYPDANLDKKQYSFNTTLHNKSSYHAEHRVDEIWMRRDIAEDCGVDVSGTNRRIIVAKLIDDKLYRAQGSPYWYPEFPYVHWRNFLDMLADGKNHNFWGYGYGTLCWTQQKVLDEFVSNFIHILRNLGVGRILAEDGAIDEDFLTQMHGAIIRLNEGFNIDAAEPIPPESVPPEIMAFAQFITGIMTEMMPSLSDTFAGEQPTGNPSGKAIQSLQYANFSQLSDNIGEMNNFRMRRERKKYALTQQFARRPIEPYLWRGGLDMQDPFPEEGRHIGYKLTMPDLTSLPNTIAGRIEVLERMAGMGFIPKNPFELLNITKGYGWTADDFIQIPIVPTPEGAAPQMNTAAANGQEPAMRSER